MKCKCGAEMRKAFGNERLFLCDECGNEIDISEHHMVDSEDICPKCGTKGRCYDESPIEDEIGGALVQVGVFALFVCTNHKCRHAWSVDSF